MSTPSSNMSNRLKRRSSIMNSPNDSSILFRTSYNTSSLLGPSTPESVSKIKKQNMTKDLLRKQQQYKTRKLKRAELIEKNRNLSKANENDQNELNELDENYYNNFKTEDYEHSHAKMPKLDIKEEKIEIKQEKIEHDNVDLKPLAKIETNKKNITTSSSTSIGSSIINRIASIKNTFKNIVNYAGQSSNSSKLTQPSSIKSKQNQTKTNATCMTNINNKKSTTNLNQINLKKHDLMMHRSSSTSNIKQTVSTFSKLNNNINNSNMNIKANTNTNSQKCNLKKQESTSSCKFLKSSSNLATTSTSSLKSQLGRTMCSKENYHPNRPVFKITKIKYDDRHLFDTVTLD